MRHFPAVFLATLLLASQGCNGVVPSASELQSQTADACKALFTQLDTSADGLLTDNEYLQGKPTVQGAFPALANADDATLVADLKGKDANQNGQVSLEEFVAACVGSTKPSPTPSVDCKEGQLCSPSPKPSPSPTRPPTPSPSPSESVKPSPSPTPTRPPTPSPTPSVGPSESPKPSPSADCQNRFLSFDTNGNGSVGDEEYAVGMGLTQATKNQLLADFQALDTNKDGVLSAAELCAQVFPNTATVSIYNPMTPFGPQTVHIAVGGSVTFNNVNSGVPWTIRSVNAPSFLDVPLATSPSSGLTAPFTSPGNYEYKIDGTFPFTTHGHIVVH